MAAGQIAHCSQRVERQLAHILTTDPHRALCDVVATRRQRRQRGFAAARRTDHRQGLPGPDRQAYLAEHGAVSHISEGHPLELQ